MTASEALALIKQAGTVEIHGENLRLRFPEKERSRLQPALYTLKRCKPEVIALLSAPVPAASSGPAGEQAAIAPAHLGAAANGVDTASSLNGQVRSDDPPVIWRCWTCSASGVLERPAVETCDATWERVLAAHAAATPGCHHSGLAVKDGPVAGAAPQEERAA